MKNNLFVVKTANQVIEDAMKIPPCVFENITIKFIVECEGGYINTWTDTFKGSVEDIINDVKYDKNWLGGKFLEIWLGFENKDTPFTKINLDLTNTKFNLLL